MKLQISISSYQISTATVMLKKELPQNSKLNTLKQYASVLLVCL